MNKFERVQIFSSGLDKGFHNIRVTIIMNNSLTSSKINFFIAKAVNSCTFAVVGGDFNENSTKKSASFKFCIDLGLASAVVSHKVEPVSEFFNTNHKAISIMIGLSDLLDICLNSVHKQANRDRWKFRIKNVSDKSWSQFRSCSLDIFLERMEIFNSAKCYGDLDLMWKILKKVVIVSADKVFSKLWFSKSNVSVDKQSSKFTAIDEEEAVKVCGIIESSVCSGVVLYHLSCIKKSYCKSKYYEFKAVKDDSIKKTINKCMENFCSDKGRMIKSVLNYLVQKVILDYLVIDNELVLKSQMVKLMIRKYLVSNSTPVHWLNQYVSLNYVDNVVFSGIICNIRFNKFLQIVKFLSDGKTAGLSGIPNELWKHDDHPAVQITGDNLKINSVIEGSTTSRKREFAINKHNNKFKVATTPDTATLEYYQSIYIHCKQRFNIPDGIEVVKKSVYQYIENCINNYLFGNYNISEVKSNFYNNLVHYSQLRTENLNSETLVVYFQELNFNIIEYCKEKYPVQSQYSIDFESETETSNKDKQKLKQYSRTTPNTPILPKTTAKHLQTPEQRTSVKLPLSITPFPISLQEPILTNANIIDYLQENESNYSESLESEETESEQEETTKNEEEIATAYIAKIPEFTGKDNNTSSQEWLDKVQKAGDANGWIAARMLKAIPYFLQRTAEKWFENLEEPFENWQAFKDAFLQQFTDNNISITLRNCFCNIKQETSETFIAKLKDKLIKKVHPHTSADLATAIRHAKSYEMAMEKANHTKLLVPRNSGQQKPNYYYTQPSYLTIPEKSYFQQTVLSEDEIAAPRSNSSNHTIPPAQIAQNANLSDIFLFEFEANESPFLLSNAAVNKQKAITAMYTEATVERKPIRLILDNRPAQTVIVTADGMKKTPVREIDDFLFTIDKITIPVKVLVMDAPQYQALVRNDWLLKANANLNWETQELKILYQAQYTIVPATCGTFNKQSEKAPVFEFEEEKEIPLTKTYMALGLLFNWAEKTEQKIFEELRRWKKVRYSTPEP
ncbi:hypothetical protein G9A89_021659 [Geosiphon pyriformis]|nr:hypothetical protein G9A89_021659 [Geosiphon pyriformis]